MWEQPVRRMHVSVGTERSIKSDTNDDGSRLVEEKRQKSQPKERQSRKWGERTNLFENKHFEGQRLTLNDLSPSTFVG